MPTQELTLRLAQPGDAVAVARMSQTLVERGLGWSWTPARVARQIHCRDTLVLLALHGGRLAGFAIMRFGEWDAHLLLLAVSPRCRRAGVGRRLVAWLERSARTAGVLRIHLEVRAVNRGGRAFYAALGYVETGLLRGYYGGREDAVRMLHDLRATAPEDGS